MSNLSIAVAVSLALSAAAAKAQTGTEEAKTLPKVSVAAPEPEETVKVDRVSSPKFTQDLIDTPQTIAVVSKEVLKQQGATTLSQALRNTPGVTFLLGENGNTATGDSIFMRGFDTQGCIFVDGIRDLGTVSRDTFNTEQVEIAKGPAGPDYGRSAASGYVNLASKVPAAESFSSGSASYGTSSNARITGDVNYRFEGSDTALRLNVMGQDGEVDGRDFIERKGWAFAPSLAFGLDGDTRSYFYLLHTEQDNIPDGGVTTLGLDGFYNPAFAPGGPNAGVVPEPVDSENFYGFPTDFEEVKGTMFTARFEHDFSDTVTLRNTSRYGKLRQFYVLTGVNALTVTRPGSRPVDRGAHAPEQVPGKHAAHQPDQHHRESRAGLDAARPHRRSRVHQRRAIQPGLRGRESRRRSAGQCLQPQPQRSAARLCSGAQWRVHARRDPDFRRVPVRHADRQRELAGNRRISPRFLRHEFRRCCALDR